MLSERKLQANRLNAQKSTGPRTDAGKQRAALNAVKTGLFCGKTVVLPGESQAHYDALRDLLFDSIDQDDPFELMLAERMVAARWKIARLNTAERRTHNEQSEATDGELNTPICKLFVKHQESWDELSRHEQRLENQLFKAMRELRQWRAEKRKSKNEPTGDETPQSQTPVSEQSEEPDSSSHLEREAPEPSLRPSPGVPGEGEEKSAASEYENEPTAPDGPHAGTERSVVPDSSIRRGWW